MRFVLASASPARLATLTAAGVEPEVVVSGVDEDEITAPTTDRLVAALAAAKASAVAMSLDGPPALVLGCDSLLEFDGQALGKPHTSELATSRWRAMSGRSGVLHSGHHLIDTAAARAVTATASATVHFADVSEAEIATYVATGEPLDVAGAFTLDGLGGWFIERIEGDPHTVVGVSLPRLRTMLAELGRDLTDLGYPAAT